MSVAEFKMAKMDKEQYPVNPKKFMMWVFLVSVTMLFAAFTSGMIVRRGDGNWTYFIVPGIFTVTTIIAVLSSITMQWAYYAAKKNNLFNLRLALFLTVGLGISFAIGQFEGYKALVAMKVYLVGNPSESFFYIVTGIHLVHILGGLLYVIYVLINAFRYKVHSTNMLAINLCTTYGHFVGGLWIYLFVILNVLR